MKRVVCIRPGFSAAIGSCLMAAISCLLFTWTPAWAQEIPTFDPTLRSGERREPLLKDKPDAAVPEPRISTPPLEQEAPAEDPEVPLGPWARIDVREIRTVGNTIFSDAQLATVTSAYVERELTYEQLELVRRQLSRYYIEKGYVNSGAVLPDQAVEDGVVTFQIVEGELSEVTVTGNRWLKDGYYTRRIRLADGPPVNVGELEKRIQMLQRKDLVRRLRAELKPGIEAGQSVLALDVEERAPFDIRFAFNNYQSPSVGAERGLVTLAHRSLTGQGDALSLTYGRSCGLDPLVDISYRRPVTARDTELGMRYRVNDVTIVEEAFQDLDIQSESEVFALTLRHPFRPSSHSEFTLGLTGERLHSKSWILGKPFSFSAGTVDGEATVAALRFSQEYLYRTRRQVVAVHSRLSWGLDALDATIHDNGEPDGRFLVWLGQFQWAGMITPLNIQTILRADIQHTNDALLSIEQLPVGGRYSVRGYRENQLVRDRGIIASLEARIPLVQDTGWADHLHLAPFIDYGQSRFRNIPTPDPDTIYSVGAGLRWGKTFRKASFPITSTLEIYWGHQLNDVDNVDNTLQDDGIHLQLAVSAF